jgi:D-sedoheptulose 7-phosphate isomerase
MNRVEVRDANNRAIVPEAAFFLWAESTRSVRSSGNTVYFVGNGASASMSSYMAADLAKNASVHTEVFSDVSLITAIAANNGFDKVFSEPIRRKMKPGDMLVSICSSGASQNIINAVTAAEEMGGLAVTLSAMQPSNPLRAIGAINFYVPAMTYSLAETCHAYILHHWMDTVSLEAESAIYETPNPGAKKLKLPNTQARLNRGRT